MLLCPLQILLANIQTSKSSPLAICHIPSSQPNVYTFFVNKMKVSVKFFHGITWKQPGIEILSNDGLRSELSIFEQQITARI